MFLNCHLSFRGKLPRILPADNFKIFQLFKAPRWWFVIWRDSMSCPPENHKVPWCPHFLGGWGNCQRLKGFAHQKGAAATHLPTLGFPDAYCPWRCSTLSEFSPSKNYANLTPTTCTTQDEFGFVKLSIFSGKCGNPPPPSQNVHPKPRGERMSFSAGMAGKIKKECG